VNAQPQLIIDARCMECIRYGRCPNKNKININHLTPIDLDRRVK
jgi:hypothetical protein